MASTTNRNLQINLALDEGLNNAWNILRKEYEALDKPAIIRLAINNLAKDVKTKNIQFDMKGFFEELNNSNEGPTEEEFAIWWNKTKHAK